VNFMRGFQQTKPSPLVHESVSTLPPLRYKSFRLRQRLTAVTDWVSHSPVNTGVGCRV
jgi:hypothetical protein